ncbi:MAG: hypothetical protein COT91_04820 [Candidatus Doudnabacteria bacterium CG10_big_fil_rev_8_21_14_0_10_41_10]|uniref:Uncharacterized protein n=1 Tax=Candidatus Doudnabacteria bacterium CG10_big_fil_rev_8_21_14_0_10_41_10 TaxID=1974551 RepID=A0A2H0VCH2_9BACT|nr:MAG: hypothetical protein COT91_04820 [Candidatus Doudnabacteria bacterium CG10_big_fil_rev_8_21_14_0_10_41_10]
MTATASTPTLVVYGITVVTHNGELPKNGGKRLGYLFPRTKAQGGGVGSCPPELAATMFPPPPPPKQAPAKPRSAKP